MNRSIFAKYSGLLFSCSLALSGIFGHGTEAAASLSPAGDLTEEIQSLLSLERDSTEVVGNSEEIFERFEKVIEGLIRVDEWDKAIQLAKHCRNLFPTEPLSGFLLGRVQGLSGDLEKAIQTVEEALRQEEKILPDSKSRHRTRAITDLAGFLVQAGKPKEALSYLDQLKDEAPGVAVVDYLRAWAYDQLGDAFSAAKSFREAMRKDSSLAGPSDYVLYAKALDSMEQYDRANKILSKAVSRFPATPGIYLNLGLNAEARGATTEAYLDYQMELLAGGPGTPYAERARERISRIEEIQTRSQFADQKLLTMIQYLDLREENRQEGSSSPEDMRKRDGLLDQIKKAFEQPFHPFLYYLIAERALEASDWKAAIECLKEALEIYPDQVLFQVDLAKAYAQVEDTTRSTSLLKKVMLKAPHHWKVEQVVGPTSLGEGMTQ